VFVGDSTGYFNNTGYSNAFIGGLAGYSNTYGYQNAFTGYLAGNKNTSGNFNAFFGANAGFNNTSGSANCFVGLSAGYTNLTGSGLTMLGTQATASTINLSNATAVGFNAIVGCSNCMALGGTSANGYQTRVGINNTIPLTDLHIIQQGDNNLNNTRGICLQRPNGNQWRTFIDPSNDYVFQYNNNLFAYIEPIGGTFISSSDERLKKDILPLYNVLNKTLQLQPKTYHYTINSDNDRHLYGFLAQDVEKLFPEFVFTSETGYKGIAYSNFSVIAIKAIQEQQQQLKEQEQEKEELKKLVWQQQEMIKALSKRMETVEKMVMK
jgi:trimeric autotransporter adhesin